MEASTAKGDMAAAYAAYFVFVVSSRGWVDGFGIGLKISNFFRRMPGSSKCEQSAIPPSMEAVNEFFAQDWLMRIRACAPPQSLRCGASRGWRSRCISPAGGGFRRDRFASCDPNLNRTQGVAGLCERSRFSAGERARLACRASHRAWRVARSLRNLRTGSGGFAHHASSDDKGDLRRGILNALCRLDNQDAPYLDPKEWWGTRPDTSGPVYKPTRWELSDRIETVLHQELDASTDEDARWLLSNMYRTKVHFPASSSSC
jgi:hypothetical protein